MLRKAKIIAGSIIFIIVAIVLGFFYLFSSYEYAWDICREAVAKKYICIARNESGECGQFKNEATESSGLFRSWSESKRCVHRLLPFPYGQAPKLDN